MLRKLAARWTVAITVLLVLATADTAALAQRQEGRSKHRRTGETVQQVKANELPAAVAEAARKEDPNVNFTKIEKHSSGQSVYFVLHGHDARNRRVTLRLSATGKLLNSSKPSQSKT